MAGRLCSCCQHLDRATIDERLVMYSAAYRRIAREYHVDESSVRRHAHRHLGATVANSKELSAMLSAQNLLEKLGQWHERMEEQYAHADAAGNVLAAVATARTGISAIESFAKRTIDIDDHEARFQALEETLKKLQGGEHDTRSRPR